MRPFEIILSFRVRHVPHLSQSLEADNTASRYRLAQGDTECEPRQDSTGPGHGRRWPQWPKMTFKHPTLTLLKLLFEEITCRAPALFILFTCLTWNMSFNIHPSSLFDWWFRTNLKKGWSTNLAHRVRRVYYLPSIKALGANIRHPCS